MNVINTVCNQSYGADETCLLRLFNSLVRSRIDWGGAVYGSALKTA